jgi:BirA family transcriptional regulator, biotin operon repressor / biotin---[acetyl-CoA-carboxylase] ligase
LKTAVNSQRSAISDTFDLEALAAALKESRFAGKLHYFASIDSTNTHAMRQAEVGAPDGSVYFADEQRDGRGRGAHTWESVTGAGLYVSVLLRPRLAPTDALWLSLAAGLAVQSAVQEITSLEADLRWPNDLLLGKRKFCGILTELNAENPPQRTSAPGAATQVRHAVVGVGINVRQAKFPAELREIATSLSIETGREWPRQELLVALLQSLENEVTALTDSTERATQSICARLEAGSTWIRGKPVRVEEREDGDGGFAGVTDGLDARGFLRVRTLEGMRTVLSGGVRES